MKNVQFVTILSPVLSRWQWYYTKLISTTKASRDDSVYLTEYQSASFLLDGWYDQTWWHAIRYHSEYWASMTESTQLPDGQHLMQNFITFKAGHKCLDAGHESLAKWVWVLKHISGSCLINSIIPGNWPAFNYNAAFWHNNGTFDEIWSTLRDRGVVLIRAW